MIARHPIPLLLLAATLVLLGSTAAISAETVVTTVDSALIRQVLNGMEIEYETWLDDYGDPIWTFTYRGILTTLSVYDETSSGGYESILLYAGWSTTETTPLETVNAWNRISRFGRAYIDESGDPAIELDLLVAGGVTEATIQTYIEVFAAAAATLGVAVQL